MIKTAVNRIIELLEETELVRSVEFSDIDEFINKKTDFFPAAHVDISTVDVNDISLDINFNVIVADELDGGKVELDSISLTMSVIGRLIASLQRLSEDSNIQMTITEIASAERVFESGTKNIYGWSVNFTAQVPNVYHDA